MPGNKNIVCRRSVLEGNTAVPHAGLLTTRELEVVNYVKKGLPSREIAGRMNVALKTVEVHRHNNLKKLKLRNSSSLVEFMNNNTANGFGK